MAPIISDPFLSDFSLYRTDTVVLSDLIYSTKVIYGLHDFPVVNNLSQRLYFVECHVTSYALF